MRSRRRAAARKAAYEKTGRVPDAAAFDAKDAQDLRGAPVWDHAERGRQRIVKRSAHSDQARGIMIVGFIGLGTMGAPMARNILEKGHRLVVVRRAACSRGDADGGRRAPRPRRPAKSRPRSEVVITMLPDAPDVERVALGPDGIVAGIRRGIVYIDMSTIDPATTRTVGAAIVAKGAAMIDSPVGKTADAAVAGTLTLMVGGDADDRRAVPAGARLHGHRLLPLRRARRRVRR